MTELVPLGQTEWRLWPDVIVRGAGFAAERIHELADPPLAEVAGALLRGEVSRADYETTYRAAIGRLSAAVRRTANEPWFREAVTWQNRAAVRHTIDKAAAGEPRNAHGRKHELVIATYLQRYTLKNDTIGFFGPVSWGRWTDSAEPVSWSAGREFLAGRTVYFESWVIDTLAAVLAEDPSVTPWLRPCRKPANVIRGGLAQLPRGGRVVLTPTEDALLGLCDGTRTVRDLAHHASPGLHTETEVVECLARCAERDLVTLGLAGPVEARPEATLRDKLAGIGDPAVRDRALAALTRLTDARQAVADAAGDAERLAGAIDRLNATFTELTGAAAVRRPGMNYAGRTLVYEDTVRDTHFELGAPLVDALAEPLDLVLRSARWLLGRIAEEYRALLVRLHRTWLARHSSTAMPLATLLAMATPDLMYSSRRLPRPVRTAVADFQRRWAAALPTDRGHLTSAELAERFAELFPASAPAWSGAVHQSPDLMVAGASQEAIAAGDYLIVLGELHLAYNPFECRVFVEQHPDPDRLRALDAADHGTRRIYLVPPKDWPSVTSRLAPPSALLDAGYTYWSLRAESVTPAGPTLALADLDVHPADGMLTVTSRTGTVKADLIEMLGELLSAVSVNAFVPFAPAPHRPRVTIDRLVVSRETWTFPATELDWPLRSLSEPDRFLAAQEWRSTNGIPGHAFYRSPTEDKPVFVDFASIALVNLFAKITRAAASKHATITITELLPDLNHLWFRDHAGAGYTAELRTVVVDCPYE